MSWSNLFYFLLTIILLSVLSGSIGILCSALCRRSITAVILSFAFYFIIYVLTYIPVLLRAALGRGNAGESMLILLFNPTVFFEEFFMHIMTGESLLGGTGYAFSRRDVGFLTYHLSTGKTWMFVSAACILLLSLLFMLAAAWKVNPMHSSSGRKPGKAQKK